ncbi:MAG: hypothetical protein ACREIA_02185 [Opitutaceae bacterium]
MQRDADALETESALRAGLRSDLQRSTLDAMRRANAPDPTTREPPSRQTPEATLQSVIRATLSHRG